MADEAPIEYFVERIANMSHANGVFRITFAQQAEGETLRPQVRLMIPANQLSPILQGISNAAKDIGEQVQARIEENKDEPPKKRAVPKKAKAPK
jgi:TRAP-type mannitol/chloroaromatic compound transport system permease small subunit